jgi:hypothetical protein
MCAFHQTSPESVFTKQRLATLATPEGRLMLLGNRLIEMLSEPNGRWPRKKKSSSLLEVGLESS